MKNESSNYSQLKLLSFLWPYLKPFTARIVVTLIILIMARLTNVGVPLVLKRIVDSFDAQSAILVVPVALLVAYGSLRFLTTLFTELKEIIGVRIGLNVVELLIVRVFRHLHTLSLRFHVSRETGRLTRDMERGAGGVMSLINIVFFMILPIFVETLLVLSILIKSYDYTFVIIVLSALSVYIIFTFSVTEWRQKFRKKTNEADSEANAFATDSLLNYETVKYFGNEPEEITKYSGATRKRMLYGWYSNLSASLLNLGQSLIITSAIILIMWRATVNVVAGTMTIGDLVLVNALMLQLYIPLHMLGMIYRNIRQIMADMEKMYELSHTNIEVKDVPDAPELQVSGGEVRFENVNFFYEPNRQILHNISFTVGAGRTVALVGHSGGGKSTISKLLFRFYDVTDGAIYIDGQDIRTVSQDSLRGAMGIVPQDTVLFNDTIGYNIAYGRTGASTQEVEDAARMAQLYELITLLPDGFDTIVGERGLKLSGGEKQRVAIARTLLKNPPIYVFDEATSSLDSNSEQQIQEELDALAKDRTTLMIAHRLSTIVNADEILVIDHGRIAERGTHHELLATEGIYAKMWHLQQAERLLGR